MQGQQFILGVVVAHGLGVRAAGQGERVARPAAERPTRSRRPVRSRCPAGRCRGVAHVGQPRERLGDSMSCPCAVAGTFRSPARTTGPCRRAASARATIALRLAALEARLDREVRRQDGERPPRLAVRSRASIHIHSSPNWRQFGRCSPCAHQRSPSMTPRRWLRPSSRAWPRPLIAGRDDQCVAEARAAASGRSARRMRTRAAPWPGPADLLQGEHRGVGWPSNASRSNGSSRKLACGVGIAGLPAAVLKVTTRMSGGEPSRPIISGPARACGRGPNAKNRKLFATGERPGAVIMAWWIV